MRVVMVVAILAISSIARADDTLAKAKRLEAGLEYEKALVVADRAIAAGGNDVATYVELELLAGRVAAGLEKPAIAREHFARALEIDRTAALLQGSSPKLTAPFEAARAASAPLHVLVAVLGRVVRVTIDTDRLALASRLRVHVGDRAGTHDQIEQLVDSGGHRTIDMAIANDASAPTAEILDDHGNVLAVLTPGITAAPPPPPRTSLSARWSTWAISSAVALAAGGVCAWQFGSAQNDWNRLSSAGGHDYSELTAIEDRGRHWGIAADIGFGVAAAAGIVAVVLYLRGDSYVTPTATGIAAHF